MHNQWLLKFKGQPLFYIQSYPLPRMCFSQYQTSWGSLGWPGDGYCSFPTTCFNHNVSIANRCMHTPVSMTWFMSAFMCHVFISAPLLLPLAKLGPTCIGTCRVVHYLICCTCHILIPQVTWVQSCLVYSYQTPPASCQSNFSTPHGRMYPRMPELHQQSQD